MEKMRTVQMNTYVMNAMRKNMKTNTCFGKFKWFKSDCMVCKVKSSCKRETYIKNQKKEDQQK